jgi:hypothetical protein
MKECGELTEGGLWVIIFVIVTAFFLTRCNYIEARERYIPRDRGRDEAHEHRGEESGRELHCLGLIEAVSKLDWENEEGMQVPGLDRGRERV